MFKKNIFRELKESDNEIFTNLNKKDLEYLLFLINLYKLRLREKINVDFDETFGLEIECEDASWDKIGKHLLSEWELTDDISLHEGAEIKSPPLRDTKENWLALKDTCSVLRKHASIGINTGGHVHVGVQALGSSAESLMNFMKLWAVYEHIIYRFSYGEFTGPRPGIKSQAKSSRIDFVNSVYLYENRYSTIEEILRQLSLEKCSAVNFNHMNTFKTLEFRCPNASLNPVIWQNNVNLFVKMMLYSKSSRFNNAFLDKKMRNILINEKKPNQIYVDDALEFIDLIFDNNLDKIYFLRQYLKSFEATDTYDMAKTFC